MLTATTKEKQNPASENTHRPQLYDERHLILLILFFLSCNIYLLHKILPSAFHLITYSLCCACCLPSHTSSTKYSIFKFHGLCWSSYKAPKPERVATQQENKGAELLLTSRNTELLELNTQARTGFGWWGFFWWWWLCCWYFSFPETHLGYPTWLSVFRAHGLNPAPRCVLNPCAFRFCLSSGQGDHLLCPTMLCAALMFLDFCCTHQCEVNNYTYEGTTFPSKPEDMIKICPDVRFFFPISTHLLIGNN